MDKDIERQSAKWEAIHTNNDAIWEGEIDKEPLREAITLSTSDPVRAFQIWLMLAEAGSVWSMSEIARCYRNGRGVSPDLARAEEWYRRAIAHGSQNATLAYAGWLISRGDLPQAEAALRTEIEKGWPPALHLAALGRIRSSKASRRFQEALPYLELAAEGGHPLSRLWLGRLMAWGCFGLHRIPRGFVMMAKNAIADGKELERRNEEYKSSLGARLTQTGR